MPNSVRTIIKKCLHKKAINQQEFEKIMRKLDETVRTDMQNKCDECFYLDRNGSTCEFCARNYPDRYSARMVNGDER